MKLSPENLALVERIDRFRVPTGDALHEHVSICASTMEALLNAARLEGVGCCQGCGSTRPIEGLRADGYRSCCPERKMFTAKQWAKRAEAAEALLREAAALFRFYEASHLTKKTQEGDEKAHRNGEIAGRIEAALLGAGTGEGPSR